MSTTGASAPIVPLELFKKSERQRAGRPLVVLDLAVPRDFDPQIAERPGVWLYSIDDLSAACAANRKSRQSELPAAFAIIEEETQRFMGDLLHRTTVPVIEQLRAGWNETGVAELDRLFRRLPHLDGVAQAEIRQAFEPLCREDFTSTAGIAAQCQPLRIAPRSARCGSNACLI